jgi:hypothetical protein
MRKKIETRTPDANSKSLLYCVYVHVLRTIIWQLLEQIYIFPPKTTTQITEHACTCLVNFHPRRKQKIKFAVSYSLRRKKLHQMIRKIVEGCHISR